MQLFDSVCLWEEMGSGSSCTTFLNQIILNFSSLLLSCLRLVQSSVYSRARLTPPLRHGPHGICAECPYIVIQWSLSTLAGGNESDTYLCELWEAFSSAPQLLSFPWKFLLILVELHPVHACADFYLSKDSRGPYLELWSFISEQLLNLKYSACYSSCLGLPEFQSVSSSQ